MAWCTAAIKHPLEPSIEAKRCLSSWNRKCDPHYSLPSSSAAPCSPIRRAPTQMSSEPTRRRERANRGAWSRSRTPACLRVGCPQRRSSCLAFARARSKSGCIIDAPWGKRRSIDGRCDIGRGDTAPSHVTQNSRAFRAQRYPTGVQGALLTNDPQLPLESPPECPAVVGFVRVGRPPLGGAPVKPRALAVMTGTPPTDDPVRAVVGS
jgi:hypothetical protein